MLTEYDQKELNNHFDDPEFSKLYNELIFLKELRYPDLIVQFGPLNASGNNGEITPKDLDRRDLKFRLFVTGNKKTPLGLAELLAEKMLQDAKNLADRMAYFFPSAKHRRWKTIFTIMAMNGHTGLAKIGQKQAGKRPKGISDKTEKRYRDLVIAFYKTTLSQEEFCREKGISRSTLNRALQFVSKNR